MLGFDPTSAEASTHLKHYLDPHPNEFRVQFWGVRGNIPTPCLDNLRFGGNTACVEVLVGGHRLILDGGTGLRLLGKQLRPRSPVSAHIFFTHTHWDRIQGFPFFMPAFGADNRFDIYGAMGPNGASIKQRLCDQMLLPNFPVPLQAMQADLHFHEITAGSIIPIEDITVETISLNRPHSALGYRIAWNGHSVVYATDTDHESGALDQGLLYLAHQADVLIYDAFYTDHIYHGDQGAEHRPALWKTGIELAIAANVKQVVLFHHDPEHDDDFLEQVEKDIQLQFPNVLLAREGMRIALTPKPTQAKLA